MAKEPRRLPNGCNLLTINRRRILKSGLAIWGENGDNVAPIPVAMLVRKHFWFSVAMAIWALALKGTAQVLAPNVVGYHTVQTCEDGGFLIANSLQNGSNELNRILMLPDWASGSTIYKFDGPNQRYFDPIEFYAGYGWYSPTEETPMLNPGEGAFIITVSNGRPASVALTFVGEIPPTDNCRNLEGVNNLEIWSPPFGKGVELLSPREGDVVSVYACAGEYSVFTYIDEIGWLNNGEVKAEGPPIPPGVAVQLRLQGWERSSCPPCVACDGAAATIMENVPLSDPRKEGTTFSFSFDSRPETRYQAQFMSLDKPDWSDLGAPLKATSATTRVADTNAVSATKFYRVVELPPPPPGVRLVNAQMMPESFLFSFESRPSAIYQVQYAVPGRTIEWVTLGQIMATKTNTWVTDRAPASSMRFYRVIEVSETE